MKVVFTAIAAILLVTSGMASADDVPPQCGSFSATCAKLPKGDYGKTEVFITGYLTGNFSLFFSTYSDDACNTGAIDVNAVGNWLDLGLKKADDPKTRNWQVTYSSVKVTPKTDDAAQQLATACACGGTWTKGTQRTLTGCPTGSCSDTSWMGGLKSGKGIDIGFPAFGFSTFDSGNFTLSWLDQDYNVGMNLKPGVDDWNKIQQQVACGAPKQGNGFCGEWTRSCSPAIVDGALASDATFDYQGPVGGLLSSGVYRGEENYYADSRCATPYFTVTREGTWMTSGTSKNIPGGYQIQQVVPYTLVTPHTDDAANKFQQECPCHGHFKWRAGVTHRITSCPPNTCSLQWFSDVTFQTQGVYSGNAVLTTRDDSTPELQQSALTLSPQEASAQTSASLGHPLLSTSGVCKYPADSVLSICGTWKQECSTEARGDVTTTLAITGSAGDASHGTGTGTIIRTRKFYPAGSGCGNVLPDLTILESGFWTDEGNSTTTELGARQISVHYVTTAVTILDADIVKSMNNHFTGCPCGGNWTRGATRILKRCPDGTCKDRIGLFGGGTLNYPGYGIIRDEEDLIRISPILESQTGFDQSLQITDLPFHFTQSCPAPQYRSDFDGVWDRPCSVDNGDTEFGAHLHIDGKSVSFSTTFYESGFGCLHNPTMEIEQEGTISYHGTGTQVPKAYVSGFNMKSVSVTPHTQEALNSLQQQCSCSTSGSIWKLKKTTVITQPCPANTCTGFDTLRMPLGGETFGLLLRENDFLRLSAFTRSQSDAQKTVFDSQDFYFVEGTVPTPAPSSKHKMDAGGVLLLIAFFGLLAYGIAGMAWNYRNEGIPRLPHVEFWKGLPGLVSDGFAFTKSKIGLGSGRSYNRMVNPEVSSSSTTGYGAL